MSFFRYLFTGVFVAVIFTGCSSPISDADRAAAKQSRTSAAVQTSAPLSVAVANLSYTGIFARPVTLKNGHWEGAPFVEGAASRPALDLATGFTLSGDLDRDGVDEIVVFLSKNSGGSGTNIYVAVADVREGKNVNLATALVGDRVQLRSGHIHEARIMLDVVQQGPGDAACCPSQLTRRGWTLTAGGLHEDPAVITGTLSIHELAGKEWVLTELQADKRVPGSMKATLVLEGDRISGTGGCNRYFASVLPGEMPGELVVSGTGSTRMACPTALMKFEAEFLTALGNVTRYGFLNGQLAFTGQLEGQVHTMLFSRAPE